MYHKFAILANLYYNVSIVSKLSNFFNIKSNRNDDDIIIKEYNISDFLDLRDFSVGKLGEELAKKYYQNSGYKIVETNTRKRFGEIDIIAQSNGKTIFCEVKTRSSDRFGSAVESLTHTKKKRILRMIRYYCLKNKVSDENIRADFIAIQIDGDIAELKHFQGIELF